MRSNHNQKNMTARYDSGLDESNEFEFTDVEITTSFIPESPRNLTPTPEFTTPFETPPAIYFVGPQGLYVCSTWTEPGSSIYNTSDPHLEIVFPGLDKSISMMATDQRMTVIAFLDKEDVLWGICLQQKRLLRFGTFLFKGGIILPTISEDGYVICVRGTQCGAFNIAKAFYVPIDPIPPGVELIESYRSVVYFLDGQIYQLQHTSWVVDTTQNVELKSIVYLLARPIKGNTIIITAPDNYFKFNIHVPHQMEFFVSNMIIIENIIYPIVQINRID